MPRIHFPHDFSIAFNVAAGGELSGRPWLVLLDPQVEGPRSQQPRARSALTAGLRAGVRRLSGSQQKGLASGTLPEHSVAGPPCHGAVFSGPRGLSRCHLVMLGWSGTLGECLGPLF